MKFNQQKIASAQWSRSSTAAFIRLSDRRSDMIRKIMTVAVLGASLAIAACNTVRGAASDVNSVANEVDRNT
jgi:predicted small secreted protein